MLHYDYMSFECVISKITDMLLYVTFHDSLCTVGRFMFSLLMLLRATQKTENKCKGS